MRSVAEKRKEWSQLIGDFLREAFVLLIVLYPLDAYLQTKFAWLDMPHFYVR
jgi:hypothetical protein